MLELCVVGNHRCIDVKRMYAVDDAHGYGPEMEQMNGENNLYDSMLIIRELDNDDL